MTGKRPTDIPQLRGSDDEQNPQPWEIGTKVAELAQDHPGGAGAIVAIMEANARSAESLDRMVLEGVERERDDSEPTLGAPDDGSVCPNCGGPEGYPSDHAVGCPLGHARMDHQRRFPAQMLGRTKTHLSGELIWHDPEGVWVDVGTGLLGPFDSEDKAERVAAAALVREVSLALAERTDDDNAQGFASDLNQALVFIEGSTPTQG